MLLPDRAHELNLDPDYWRTKFLYPFALDPAPLRLDGHTKQLPEEVVAEKKRQKLMAEEGVMATSKFQFPISQMKKPQEYLPEVKKPITLTLEDIKQDMNSYVKKFPEDIIPHITEAQDIVDKIHNYPPPPTLSPSQNKSKAATQNSFETETQK